MIIVLQVMALFSLVLGLALFAASTSAIHEIEAILMFLIMAVFLSGGVIATKVQDLQKKEE